MTQCPDIPTLETGSAFAYLKLGQALAKGGKDVTEAHVNALVAGLTAAESMESRVYFSPGKGQFLYLPPLSGPALFAALFAFSKALLCKPYAVAMRDVLKKWVDGDARSVGLAMTVLKWGADLKSSIPPMADHARTTPSVPPPYVAESMDIIDPHEIAALLRAEDPAGWSKAVETLLRVAQLGGVALNPVLPALVDALAEEYRDRILQVLTVAVRTGLDLNPVMPVLGGLLLDRDYYDAETVGQLFRCLTAAAESGADLAPVWPYIRFCMEERDLKLKLLFAGAVRGLPTKGALPYLLSRVDIPIVPDPADDPSAFSTKLEGAALALEILALGASRGDFRPADLEGASP